MQRKSVLLLLLAQNHLLVAIWDPEWIVGPLIQNLNPFFAEHPERETNHLYRQKQMN